MVFLKTVRGKALPILLLSLFAVFANGCATASYLWQAGTGQLALYNRERPLEEVVEDPRTPEAVREKLKWVPEIKQLVEAELGVKATSNYTTYVDLKRPYVIWSITVAEPFELKLREWSFPFMGSFPYLGFFKEEKARKWLDEYTRKGYDTSIRGVTAYSTLGYLRDPLLSSMLTREKRDLVNLIFHETTHGHIYLKGEGGFNEQLASYIGDYGERGWLIKTFGSSSPEAKSWEEERTDRRLFGQRLREFADELRAFYASSTGLSLEKRIDGKGNRFEAFRKRLLSEQWRSHGMAVTRINRLAKLINNNAALLAYLTYEDDQAVFDLLDKKCEGHLPSALRYLKRFADEWDRHKKSALSARTDPSKPVTPQSVLYARLVDAGGGLCLDANRELPR